MAPTLTVAFLRTESNRTRRQSRQRRRAAATLTVEGKCAPHGVCSVCARQDREEPLLRKFTAARAAARNPAAPAPTLVPSSGPATVESLGQQLREVLPTRRLQSVSLCDHEANVLWLSEGALGPDEHMLVMEALDILNADSSLPCHETALEDGRLGVFLPVRAPTGSLVGVAMILADSKSVGDDTLERMTASPVRTIMQRLAVLLKPNGLVATGTMPIPVELPEDAELPELALAVPAEAAAPEAAAPEAAAPAHVAAPVEEPDPELLENAAAELELALVSEMEVAPPPPPAPAPASASEPEEICETIITAAEIANILELSLVPDELPHAASSTPAPAPTLAPQPPAPTRAAPKPSAPVAVAAPVAMAPAPPVPVAAPAAANAPIEVPIADSGMLRLEFLAEPPVVRPPPNPTALARKLQAASKAAEVAPTRAPRALPTAPPPRAVPAAAPPAAAAKGKAPIAAAPPARTAAPAVPPVAAPAASPAPAASAAARPAMQGSGGPVRNPFEPIPPNSRLSLDMSDDVVVLFEAEPVSVPARSGVPPKVAPPAQTAAAAKPAPVKAAAPAPTRPAAPARITPPPRSAPAVRNAPPPRPAPAARAPAPAPAPAVAPAPSPAPPPAPAAPAPVSAAPAPVAAAAISVDASPQIDLIPFAKLRAGGQNRRFQVQPRSPANRDSAAVDEQTLQQLFAWLAGQRALWSTVPTSFTVNLSVATLEDERFLTRIGAALNTHGISPDTLGFEIAETLCAQQRAKVERFIAQCEKLGAWIAIDDFSFDSQVLPLLRSKALRLLKLDARLTAAALRDKLSQAMVVATVQAAKVLGIHCSAKKADSQASLQYLTAIGLDYAQGAALARAVPLEAIGTISDARPGGVVEDIQ
jgi:EAL domain-containing protein (putative c-di-GMP-specific phosphodiesterase class I)